MSTKMGDGDDDERRSAELEVIESMFGGPGFEVLENAQFAKSFKVALELEQSAETKVIVRFDLPSTYPSKDMALVSCSCMELTPSEGKKLNDFCKELAMKHQGEEAVFLILDAIRENWGELHQDAANSALDEVENGQVEVEETLTLGRRLMYSHHIISDQKRKLIKEWGVELNLAVYCKIGWPGIIVCEGNDIDVQEYVSRLQRLRWKHFVVRGEQLVENVTSIDDVRALPHEVVMLGDDEMSVLAEICRRHGLEDLFLTSMKIYK